MSLPNTPPLDGIFNSTIATRQVVDMTIDTEQGLDVELDYNRETDETGATVATYYRIVFTPHAGRNSSIVQVSPSKIPALVAALNELHSAWQQDVKISGLSGITVNGLFLDALARGMRASELLEEVLAQAGLSDTPEVAS